MLLNVNLLGTILEQMIYGFSFLCGFNLSIRKWFFVCKFSNEKFNFILLNDYQTLHEVLVFSLSVSDLWWQ